MGVLVTATLRQIDDQQGTGTTTLGTHAEIAPPPLAWPSILVTIMAPKSALSLNARLCASAA